jgi:hypothetical protein
MSIRIIDIGLSKKHRWEIYVSNQELVNKTLPQPSPVYRKREQGNQQFRFLSPAAIWLCKNLQKMAVGVLEINAAAAVVSADLARALAVGIGPALRQENTPDSLSCH